MSTAKEIIDRIVCEHLKGCDVENVPCRDCTEAAIGVAVRTAVRDSVMEMMCQSTGVRALLERACKLYTDWYDGKNYRTLDAQGVAYELVSIIRLALRVDTANDVLHALNAADKVVHPMIDAMKGRVVPEQAHTDLVDLRIALDRLRKKGML